jgi:phosphoglycolate phosphatase
MRLMVFDLDGTLVDSLPDLTAALNRTLSPRGAAPLAVPDVAPLVGDGVAVLLQRACALRGLQEDDALLAAYLAEYSRHVAKESRPFPGIPETLTRLQSEGWKFAVCTNKPEVPARAVLAELGLAGFFVTVGGGDSFPARKPNPVHLLGTIQAAGGAVECSLMVGDHHNDVRVALAAGTQCIFAAWGYGTPEMAQGAAAIAADATSLPDLASRLLPP